MKDCGNIFTRCPECHHLNITDRDFYTINCSKCNNVFINKHNTNHLWDKI